MYGMKYQNGIWVFLRREEGPPLIEYLRYSNFAIRLCNPPSGEVFEMWKKDLGFIGGRISLAVLERGISGEESSQISAHSRVPWATIDTRIIEGMVVIGFRQDVVTQFPPEFFSSLRDSARRIDTRLHRSPNIQGRLLWEAMWTLVRRLAVSRYTNTAARTLAGEVVSLTSPQGYAAGVVRSSPETMMRRLYARPPDLREFTSKTQAILNGFANSRHTTQSTIAKRLGMAAPERPTMLYTLREE